MWMEYHNAQKCPWVLVFLFKSYMKTSRLLFLNAFSVKDAFSISDAFFYGLELHWMWALWGVRLWFCSSFWWCPAAAQNRERGDCGDPASGSGSAVIPRLCYSCLRGASVLMRSDAPLLLPSPFFGVRGHPAVPVSACASPPTPACLLLSTSFHFNTRFTPTSQMLLAMHNLNTFFFCIVHYTRCRFYRHESALFCLCVSTAVLECSGLFPYLLSTLPPPLHTHFFLKADILKHVLRGSFHLQYFSHRKGQ